MTLGSATATNACLAGLSGTGTVNVIPYVSLHSATPGATGASEMTGGSYARQACSWNSPSGGSMTNSTALTFSTTGSTAVTYAGTWSASTSGTYAEGLTLGSSVTAASITIAAGALSLGVTA